MTQPELSDHLDHDSVVPLYFQLLHELKCKFSHSYKQRLVCWLAQEICASRCADLLKSRIPSPPCVAVQKVKSRGTFKIYEIKTASSARGCIREAIGQLMDYTFWPIESAVDALFVAGEPPLTADAVSFLARLNECLPMPLGYIQVQPTD